MFQIGAATTAAANGVSNVTIQTLGWWASDALVAVCSLAPAGTRSAVSDTVEMIYALSRGDTDICALSDMLKLYGQTLLG